MSRYLLNALVFCMASVVSNLAPAAGWNVSAAAETKNFSNGMRIVTVAVTDQDGKGVEGLNQTSFSARMFGCVARSFNCENSTVNIASVADKGGGMYFIFVSFGSIQTAAIALRVAPAIAQVDPKAVVVGATPPPAPGQMALVVIPIAR